MSAAFQLPIEILPQSSSGGISQFGSFHSAASGNSTGQQPFSEIMQSLSAKQVISSSSASTPDSKTGSDTQDKTSSAEITNYYGGLLSAFLGMSKGRGEAANSDSGTSVSTGTSASGLLAKIEKEISALLGGGLPPASAIPSTWSDGLTSGKGTGAADAQYNSATLGRILSNPAIQSDVQELLSALSADSAQSTNPAFLQQLLLRAQEAGANSETDSNGSAGNSAWAIDDVQGMSLSQLADLISKSLQSSGSTGGKATSPTSILQPADSRLGVQGAADNHSAIPGSSATSTSGELKKLLSTLSGIPADKSVSVSTERVAAESQSVAASSNKTVQQILQVHDAGSDPEISGFRSAVQGVYAKSTQTQVLPGTTGSLRAAPGTVRNAASAGSPQILSDIEAASSPIAAKAGNNSTAAVTGKTGSPVAGIESQKAAASLTQGKQDSSKSEGKLPDLANSSTTELARNASVGANAGTSFKETLSATSLDKSGAAEAKPNASQVAQTILRGANMLNEGKKTVVTLKLEPESLGSVSLQVSSESGKISAQFDVKTPDARAFLEASIPQMKQMLQSNGISLTHLSVGLSGGDARSNHPQQQSRKQQSRYYAAVHGDSEEGLRTFGYNTMEMKV